MLIICVYSDASGLLRWMVREGSCKWLDAGFGLQIYTCLRVQRLG
jgi:hypothetical protein